MDHTPPSTLDISVTQLIRVIHHGIAMFPCHLVAHDRMSLETKSAWLQPLVILLRRAVMWLIFVPYPTPSMQREGYCGRLQRRLHRSLLRSHHPYCAALFHDFSITALSNVSCTARYTLRTYAQITFLYPPIFSYSSLAHHSR
jgi:hypothetical protein